MSLGRTQRLFATCTALLLSSLILLSVLPISAQTPVTLTPGTAVTGNVPSQGATVSFTFTANAGDLVDVGVFAITPGMDPNLTLLGPQQETLVTNDNDLSDLPTTNAGLAFRVAVTGTYTVVVGGTPGDFLLTLTLLPTPTFTVLDLDVPATVNLPFTDGATTQVFAFNTDPFFATSVLINTVPFDVDAFVTVRDSSGRAAATLRGSLENACVSFAPSDELLELRITASPALAGTITVTLGRGPCQLGPAPQNPPPPVATLQIPPATIEGVCAANTIFNLNVRTGPGLQFPVIVIAFARQPLQVVGRSEDGQWLAVQIGGLQGWIAAPVVLLVGPCDQLTVLQAPPIPSITPTPGLPLVTPTPMATTGSETPTVMATTGSETPAAPTETVEGQPSPTNTITGAAPTVGATTTPDLTLEPTEELTPEVTPTVTPT